jgi:hypothetical protein
MCSELRKRVCIVLRYDIHRIDIGGDLWVDVMTYNSGNLRTRTAGLRYVIVESSLVVFLRI